MDALQTQGAWTWLQLVSFWVDDCGGWSALCDQMMSRARGVVSISDDIQTIEKGLRRLSQRGHTSGGQYGRWLLRFFGVPPSLTRWLQWMGQYHHRFTDLPAQLRAEQLMLWDKPPLNQSSDAIWLVLARVSLAHRQGDDALRDQCMARAASLAPRSSAVARMEYGLFAARHLMDTDSAEASKAALDALSEHLTCAELGDELGVYQARWTDQWVYVCRRLGMEVEEARALYDGIQTDGQMPYVAYVRALGLAYCTWKLKRQDEAVMWAMCALDDAGDAGLVRLRVVALNLLSRILGESEEGPNRQRARRLASALDDEELLTRINQA